MSWEQSTFSFEHRQPPTPTRTPTSPSFVDFFNTPKLDAAIYEHNANRTPKPPSFGKDSFGSKGSSGKDSFGKAPFGKEAGSMSGRTLGAEFAANVRNILATPDFSSLQVDHPESFGGDDAGPSQALAESATPSQLGLSVETDVDPRSAQSMQTPPPTSVSASKRQGQQKVGEEDAQQAGGRRLSAPSAAQPSFSESTPKAQTRTGPVEESPANLFSPDVFGYSFAAPATAPAYPQQRLFWDAEPGESMDTSFANMPNPFEVPRGGVGLDSFAMDLPALPTSQAGPSSFAMDVSRAALGTSSYAAPSFIATAQQQGEASRTTTTGVDPSLLFSSPSRLPAPPVPGTDPAHPRVLNEDSLQPYAYQLQEAKRDKAYAGVAKPRKRRKPSVDSPAVRAALESLRDSAPIADGPPQGGIRRSFTESALPRMQRDHAPGAPPLRPDSRQGRSSPLKRIQEARRASDRQARRRPAIALTIDANGRARAESRVPGAKPGASADDENAMDLDGPSSSATESAEDDDDADGDMAVATSFAPRPGGGLGPRMGRFSSGSSALHSHKTSNASSASSRGPADGYPRLPPSRPATAGPAGRRFGLPPLQTGAGMRAPEVETDDSEAETVVSAAGGAGGVAAASRDAHDTAQSELRKLRRAAGGSGSRPHPASAHPAFPPPAFPAPATGHPFAPLAPAGAARDHGLSKLSPTTVTDPDVATPGGSSVRTGPGNVSAGGSSASGDGSIRCVCGDSRDDGRQMIQCESCFKWLHLRCTGVPPQRVPSVYLCLLCTGATPAARGGRVRDPAIMAGGGAGARRGGAGFDGSARSALDSPLAGKISRGR